VIFCDTLLLKNGSKPPHGAHCTALVRFHAALRFIRAMMVPPEIRAECGFCGQNIRQLATAPRPQARRRARCWCNPERRCASSQARSQA